jgi:hypothetical protein
MRGRGGSVIFVGMAHLHPAVDEFPDPALPLVLERWPNDAAESVRLGSRIGWRKATLSFSCDWGEEYRL